MWRSLVVNLFLLHLCYSYDHNVFKSCAEVELCSHLRNRTPEEVFSVDVPTIASGQDYAQMTLTANDGSKSLNLLINFLQEDRIRIRVKEVDSDRYELQDVLDGEPATKPFDSLVIGQNTLTISSEDNKINIQFSPFNIEVLKNDLLVQVFEGRWLLFEDSGAFTFGVAFPNSVQLYGIHEHTDNLALQTTVNNIDPYRLKNSDLSGHEMQSPAALYGAIPVLYGHSFDATTGLFVHNAAEQWIDISNSDNVNSTGAYFMVGGGSLDLFLLLGPTPQEVVRQYVGLTGTAHLPQIWTLGHHQCRWSYMTQEDAKDVVANFNNYNFPLDVIWLDIDYTDSKKYFTWNPVNFTDPLDLQQNISATNKKLVTIIDPHIKVEVGYNVYDGALANDLFVKNPDNSNFEGDCWPGLSSYMDFLNPSARDYYANFYSYENFPDSTPVLAGIWNDMNEPSVFDDSLEKTLPEDSVHFGGVLHKNLHNIYGFLHTVSTHKGLIDRDNGTKRPFILTRSHFAGSQRYTAIWTGDNDAQWSHLAISYPECLNANILGIVFCGADVGGFSGNPDVELLQRWYQSGAWLPFYRAHAADGTDRREPYLFDDDVQEVIRNAIQTRYQHIPVWYTLFYEHTRTRDPIIRPLWYHYSSDSNTFKIDDHLLVGRDILVRAVTEPGVTSVQVYLPRTGERVWWYSLAEEIVYEGGNFIDVPVDIQAIPVFYRGGSVIARKDTVRASTAEMINDAYNIYITLDPTELANGTVYIDDNESFNYRESKEYNYVQITVALDSIALYPVDDDTTGNFEFEIDRVIYTNYPTKKDGKPGSSKKVFEKDVNGKLLKDMKFNLKERTVINFK